MTFGEIWASLVNKCPDLANDAAVVEFRSDNLRRLLRQVYDQGAKSVVRDGGAVGSFFDSLFGGKP